MNQYREQFSLDPRVAYLNHGSFGSVPKVVAEAQREIQLLDESNPNLFFRTTLPRLHDEARMFVAKWLGTTPELFAFVPNASQGVITAAGALISKPRSQIVATSLGYGGVLNGLAEIARRTQSTLRIAEIDFASGAQTADDIADSVFAALTNETNLVVLDQITSETALLLPVDQIMRTIRRVAPQARVVIDGAHGPGMLTPALPTDFDVWVGNFHKWICAPRASAGLVCRSSEIASQMVPLAPSWDFESGFPKSFFSQGTDDYSSYLATPNAIKFHESIGADKLDKHNREVLDDVATMLHEHWGTEPVVPVEMSCPWMRLVRLPLKKQLTKPQSDALTLKISQELKTETVIVSPGDATFVRLSAFIYNEPADFEKLKQVPDLVSKL
ncbi:MAG: aminotransferase class V-fold PLP-dependent enzyme [Actinobacteria bacterium]|nr:aminotransferase class V-fold PLP-dependent enzyme [Actinomycetota bacterium]MDA3016517.1 aminotransferase class V-fold PLP-dependent enzyme [Actinomycetota bacterium]